jgi:hypothetical protein
MGESAPTESPEGVDSNGLSDVPSSAAIVERGGIFVELFPFADPEAGLAVVLGSADAFPICGEIFEEVRLLGIQFIGSRPDPEVNDPFLGGRLLQSLAKGEIFATVYAWSGEALDCDFILNGDVLAEGVVRVVQTDNDVNAFLREGPIRGNAFGTIVHGTVTLANGDLARLQAVFRAVFFPPDEVKDHVRISLR